MSRRQVILIVLFSLAAFLTVYLNITVFIPGTNVVTDPREIFNAVGAVLTGPIGALLIALSSTIYPANDFRLYIIIQHCIAALWVVVMYKKVLSRYNPGIKFAIIWAFTIFAYYYIVYVPVFFALYKFFPELYLQFVGSSSSFLADLLHLYGGWIPESLLTFVYTLLILFALPHQVLSGGKSIFGSFGETKSQKIKQEFIQGRYLAFRLSLWFFIFFSLPVLYLSLLIRNYYLENLLQTAAVKSYPSLLQLSKEFTPDNLQGYFKLLEEENLFGKNFYVLDSEGRQVFPSTERGVAEIQHIVLNPKELMVLRDNNAIYFINDKIQYAVCRTNLGESGLYLCSVVFADSFALNLSQLERRVSLYLGSALFLVSVFSGALIWLVIGVPMRKFTQVSEEIANQNYTVDIDLATMSDELYILGETMIRMKNSIMTTQKKLMEQELKYRTIYSAAQDAILLIKDGLIVECNPAAELLFGDSAQNIIGKSPAYYSPEYQLNGMTSYESAAGKLSHDQPSKIEAFEWLHKNINNQVICTEVSLSKMDIDGVEFFQSIVRNINDRKAIEQELRKNELKFRSLINSIQEVVFTTNTELIITGIFGQWNESYGISENIINNSLKTLVVNPYEYDLAEDAFRKALMGDRSLFEWQKMKENVAINFESSLAPLFDADESIIGVVCVARDITDRKNTEKTLFESEERYKSLFNSLPDAVIVHTQGRLLFANHSAATLFGADSVESLYGLDILQFVHPEYLGIIKSRIADAFTQNTILPITEIKVKKFDGMYIEVEVHGTSINYGGMRVMQSVIRDVSKIKQADLELRKLGRAVEHSPSGIVITNKYGVIEYVNAKFTEATGFEIREVLGKTPKVFKSGYHDQLFYKEFWGSLLHGEEWHGELRNKKKNGELYWEQNHISSIKNNIGEITHFIAIKEDITRIKELSEELFKAKTEAEEANSLKSTLLANMSHEFRTPLNGILGYSQILQDEIADDELQAMVLKIAKSGKRLMDTLNSVLIVTELESAEYTIQNSSTSLDNIFRKLHYQYDLLADAKRLQLLSFSSTINDVFYSDEEILCKILSFLVDNGIKYTSSGSVKISGEFQYVSDTQNLLIMNVVDTGIGIKPEDQKVIFREFKQASEGFSRAYEGLGLGLAIAKKLCSLLHGNLYVESTFGQGSKFTLEIPVATPMRKKLSV